MIKKISVIFILPDLETGGAERIVTTIANHLSRDRFEPKILLLRKTGGYLNLLKNDVEIIDINTERIRHSLRPILKEIYRRKPDIVFSGFGEVNAYLALFIKLFPNIKFIARETNVVSQHVTRKEIKFFYNFYNNYQKIIAQSDDMMADLIDNFNIKENKIIKIHNPVDFDFINETLKISDKPDSFKYNFKNVVAIGNLSARKGFDNLLKVFSRLKNENIILHILGDGKDREVLHQMKEFLGLKHVVFHGRQENPYQFLKYADLFILSSRYEGFPNVLLEAGACGTYSLANNCPGGINEIIQNDINGEVSDIDNHENFAEKICSILQRNYDRDAIKNSIKSRFSKNIILDKYENMLIDLMKR
ncbi:N-acetylgalactosamine-N, N'-diacetylbacillosaminyl-diphospho-undecaprenol 4-alpha-N-acetylgalactosaminyltransferase [Chryseobacterium potabilaquae]|uniref:N-acetylgalactosamine-N, N'-diacetylbacillosaminyl-diphospho-undecaprenol 4-alpha-N-acetylgalactosaminyltransferase n=1 Tax=Chryseobacterium potabilaquae TaxID=2675057 RepID=A0A6N4XBP4_9FLAO|nr:N-acetylgalactosamine-N, N'-diacetylbacillosaminyl-diphospho-undecaprenol 4-alpha-N-acetylgalactosaminyltransferase [Chryseobacterium potabilaquae]